MYPKIDKPYGSTLVRLGELYANLVVIDADLSRACDTGEFAGRFPERYFNLGVTEANMIGVSAGLALSGKLVFCGTFACFITQRVYDQVAISVAYMQNNVKLCGMEPALTSGSNGATHQSMMDLALMRALPNMRVYDPVDAVSLDAIMHYEANHAGPAYLRGIRKAGPAILNPKLADDPHKALILHEGKDVTIIASGIMLERSLAAVDELAKAGVDARLVAVNCLKPLDTQTIVRCAAETGAIVTVENHTIIGGLGGAVAEALSEVRPVPVIRVGIRDVFGEVGSPDYLAEKFHFGIPDIVAAAYKAIELKKK
jgi:transketolase